MGHHNALPGVGVTPANIPTAAEKAALDGASPALSGTNVVAGVANLTTLPTADQKAALDASTNPNNSNPFVTRGLAGDITAGQLAAISDNPTLNSGNLVAGQADLLDMALSASGTGSTVTWNTGRTDLSPTTHKAVLIYGNTSAFEAVAAPADTSGNIVFTLGSPASGGGYLVAYLFLSGPLGTLNVT